MTQASSDSIVVDHYPAAQRSLRMAVVTETYPPEVNGVAMTLARIVEGLRQRNHDVQLIRPRQSGVEPAGQGPRFHEVLMRSLPIPRYPHLRMGAPAKRALIRLWALHRPDVVHIATEGPLGWSALQAALHLKLPVSSDFRTNFHAYSQHYGMAWLQRPIMAYLRKFHNRAQATMVPTEALRRELAASDFQRLTVVSLGVDTQRFHPDRRSLALREGWGVEADDRVVMCVGRLAAEKNLGTLLTAFEALQQRDPRMRLVLVGDGPLRAELQARCPGAVFAGQRSGDDLAAHYASADLFLFASLTETFGNVTTEAMASGLPVLAFEAAAAAQLIRTGVNGLLATPGDTAEFVRRALELGAGSPQAREQARAMGEAARRTAVALDWDGVIARFESVLFGVVDAAASPPPVPAEVPAASLVAGK